MSADRRFLRRHWPRIRQVLSFLISQDTKQAGLIENSQHNTYDINFEGANPFVGGLYLAALRAGEEMARELGDQMFAERCRTFFESGRQAGLQRLYNGQYFIQEVDLDRHPRWQIGDGCLSDQVFGQNWAHQLGLGYLYPPETVLSALQSVWKYNWAPDVGPQNAAYKPERCFATPGEAGLFICTWPKSPHHKEGVRYRDEVWTGIEYQVAAHMIWEGMIDEALAMVRAVHDRYGAAKRNPFNEVECGDHYARALASWGVFTALCGFRYHGPAGRLEFAPRLFPNRFRAAFTSAEGWGTLSQDRGEQGQINRVEIRWGRLRLAELRLEPSLGQPNLSVRVDLAGQAVPIQFAVQDRSLRIEFDPDITIREGQTLAVNIGHANRSPR